MLHKCESKERYNFECMEINNKLYLSAAGEYETIVRYCPFCGYQPERLNEKTSKEDAIV
jgi:hypothetical protein